MNVTFFKRTEHFIVHKLNCLAPAGLLPEIPANRLCAVIVSRAYTPFGEFNTVNVVSNFVDTLSAQAKNSFNFLEPSYSRTTPWKRTRRYICREHSVKSRTIFSSRSSELECFCLQVTAVRRSQSNA